MMSADTVRTRGNLTMAEKLTDKVIKSLPIPSSGNRITYDSGVRGFGVRTTSAGARSFVLNYRAGGRERRITIGSFPDWSVTVARDRAAALKRQVDDGADPMAERHTDRAAPTMNDLADRFEAEHLSKRRATTARDYAGLLKKHIRPRLGRMKVADLRHSDIERMHQAIAETAPYQANRAVSDAYRAAAHASGIAERLFSAPDVASNYALVDAGSAQLAATLVTKLAKEDIESRLWYGRGLHHEPYLFDAERDELPATDRLAPSLVGLPIACDIALADVERVIAVTARTLQ